MDRVGARMAMTWLVRVLRALAAGREGFVEAFRKGFAPRALAPQALAEQGCVVVVWPEDHDAPSEFTISAKLAAELGLRRTLYQALHTSPEEPPFEA